MWIVMAQLAWSLFKTRVQFAFLVYLHKEVMDSCRHVGVTSMDWNLVLLMVFVTKLFFLLLKALPKPQRTLCKCFQRLSSSPQVSWTSCVKSVEFSFNYTMASLLIWEEAYLQMLHKFNGWILKVTIHCFYKKNKVALWWKGVCMCVIPLWL